MLAILHLCFEALLTVFLLICGMGDRDVSSDDCVI